MPSLAAALTGFILRTTGIYRRMYSGGPRFTQNIAKVRAQRLAEPDAKARAAVHVEKREFKGRPVWHLAPKVETPSAHVLFWHGGGYVYPATPVHWTFLANMAKTHGWAITAPLYPLAPESNAAETSGWALEFYRDYIERNDGQPFVMSGDSAGGGLTAALAQIARYHALPLPAALILICPWLKLDPSHPDQLRIEPRDGILTVSGIAEGGRLYAGDLALTDPRCSPFFGEWAGLPPTLAFGGGDDILVTDGRALKQIMPSAQYFELAGMIHDWPIFNFPESRSAQKQMAEFASGAVT